ncbi:MAG: hypothetical protein ACRCX8_05085 [Sarcina sp.]
MSELKVEIMCRKCGGYGITVFPDNVKIEMSVCVCECTHSGTLNEFLLEIE